MESLTKLQQRYQPLHLSLNHHRPSFPRPISSLSLRTSSSSSPSPFKSSSLKVSSASSPLTSDSLNQNPKPHHSQTINPLLSSFPPLLKTTCITIATAAALMFVRFNLKPAIAAPTATPLVEPTNREETSFEERERIVEDELSHNPDNIEALRSLMEVRIKARKLKEAIEVLDRLIELEPEEYEWPLLRANIYSYLEEHELARKEFEQILDKDPFRVEAYHGLVMASSENSDINTLKNVAKRVEEAVEKCNKLGRKSDVRDFKLLIAQIRVVEGDYVEALKVYQQLVKEEPRDFRPYLCQGILYTLLRKKDEAEKQFEKFRRLVPKNHPYKEYFDDNMLATKLFAQKAERERGR